LPIRHSKLLSLLQNNTREWINEHVDILKAEGVETDEFIMELVGNTANDILCCKLTRTNLFSADYLPYNWIDDHPDRLIYCIERCQFDLCAAAVKTFAKCRRKKILRFLTTRIFIMTGHEQRNQRWVLCLPFPGNYPDHFDDSAIYLNAITSVDEIIRTDYQIPIRNFCLTYFALHFDCNQTILQAYRIHCPGNLWEYFK